jgi:hypothetical protein
VESRHWHPTEDDLILHFYGEGQPDSEARIDEHLRGCASCRAAWSELSGTLKLVDAARLPEAPSGFEHIVWARVEQALMRAPVVPRRSVWTPIWTMPRLVPLGAMAALVVTAVTLGVLSLRRPETPSVPATGVSASAGAVMKPDYTRERLLLTALDDHFEQTELLLVELLNTPEGAGGDLHFERTTADELVATGRLYRISAERTGHAHVAQMLEDLEPVLVEVARSPKKIDKSEFKFLRSRITDEGLLIKVRAVGNEIRERKQDLNAVTNEGGL